MKKIIVTAQQPDLKSISVLFDNINVIMENRQIILNDPDFYNIYIDGISVCSAYTGEVRIPLGVLIQLWDSEPWCTDKQYTYRIGGSPLSGLCFEQCWNAETRSFCKQNNRNFMSLARVAFHTINNEKDTKQTAVSVPYDKKSLNTLKINDVLKRIAAEKTV